MFFYDVEYFPTELKRLAYYEMEDLSQEIVKKERIECFVCGHIIHDPNVSFISRILKKFDI